VKIVLAHNFYRSSIPSGENAVYAQEKALMERKGHRVVEFVRHSDDLVRMGKVGAVKAALCTPWNPFARRELRRLLMREKPDILHVHNVFPLLSPSIFHAARNLPVATVLTLHNYRVFCAVGTVFRNREPCTECLDRGDVRMALRYGCYRESRLATIPPATMIALHRWLGTWSHRVDAFIALTSFQAARMSEAGLASEIIHVKPNFLEPDSLPPRIEGTRKGNALFVGRLSGEKGVGVAIDAWSAMGDAAPPLEIAGDGPERKSLEGKVSRLGLNGKIGFLGQRERHDVLRRMSGAPFLVVPSLCYEGLPVTILEAFASGTPVVASRLGPLPDLVREGETGRLFTPDDPVDLASVVMDLIRHPDRLAMMGRTAREVYEANYTPEANHARIQEIYLRAIREKGNRRTR
jgi:glycosyltransferase involved in cell wall biosynthesis